MLATQAEHKFESGDAIHCTCVAGQQTQLTGMIKGEQTQLVQLKDNQYQFVQVIVFNNQEFCGTISFGKNHVPGSVATNFWIFWDGVEFAVTAANQTQVSNE